MLSKARIKFIKSLQVKKYRQQEQRFVVEGGKAVEELLRSDFKLDFVAGTDQFLKQHIALLKSCGCEYNETDPKTLASLGEYKTNDSALAVAHMRENRAFDVHEDEFILVLDDIRDPGNLGTIIRTADWFGVTKIVASNETADFYNPKVLHASMGSFTRVKIYYTDLVKFLTETSLPVLGTFLDGENVQQVKWGSGGMIVIGNEAHGISEPVERLVTKRITIPKFGKAESLNAAVATAIVLDNLRRNL